MPIDAAIAISTAVEGEGSKLAVRGISIVTVAVLLINAERMALARHKTRSRQKRGMIVQGTISAAALTAPDCSRSRPKAMPPAISPNVDQSIAPKSSLLNNFDPN